MTILDNYLNELFGFMAPGGEEVSAPVINRMNNEVSRAQSSCNWEKDNIKRQICINEAILKVKRQSRSELVQSFQKCEGKRLCHRVISNYIVDIDKDIDDLNREISRLRRSK